MGAYYPAEYYSFGDLKEDVLVGNSIRSFAKRKVIQSRLKGSALDKLIWTSLFPQYMPWILPPYFSLESSILDVGCGSGFFLLSMANAGFKRLAGIDPYNQADIRYKCGVQILKTDLFAVTNRYDVVMMHHAFEHMDNPEAVLNKIWKCLNPNGIALIRIPVADSEAWKTYGPLWVQLDAPRHYFLHTVKGLTQLAHRTSFSIEHIMFDSYNLQFWGSELYKQGLKLSEGTSRFSAAQLKDWSARSAILNENGRGDQLCLYLRKKG